MSPRPRGLSIATACLLLAALAMVRAPLARGAQTPEGRPASPTRLDSTRSADPPRADFLRMVREQADTDRAWQLASDGYMRMEKITYRSSRGDLEIPAFVFRPLSTRGPGRHPALVWVHEDIRGHLYERHIPFIRDAAARGYVVIAPEYRGSIGYGRAFYDAIDYGGAEVDDVVTAVTVLKSQYPEVAPDQIGIIGWSHGALISLLAIFRNPTTFRAAAALVPVTNLFHRLARKGVEPQRRAIDPQNRFGGSPAERPDVYRYRSPLFHVDNLRIPLLVHIADNDEDVNIDEAMQLADALRARKPDLADVKVYHNPPGGHLFDRRVFGQSRQPENTPEQRDAWTRIWTFFERQLIVTPIVR
ncbi:MAG TPA: alpha/beta fold hydrolase [Vicinamibacterales bacterium]|nr:alpha/beta fold hydrolase [Vicinamibacterales bacterium]